MQMEREMQLFHFPTEDYVLASLGWTKREILGWLSDRISEQGWDQPQILPKLQKPRASQGSP